MSADSEQVAEYLKSHPEFFEANAAWLADIHIPHPHGGRAISIGERQVVTLREKNRLLESKLSELITFGEENDALAEKVHRYALAIVAARDFDGVLAAVYGQMQDNFHVPHTLVRLWPPAPPAGGRPETEPTPPDVRELIAALKTPYCGQHAVYETNRWFGEAAPHLKSFAIVRLGGDAAFGALLLASEDAQRFYPEMGTVFLARLGELTGAAIAARLAGG